MISKNTKTILMKEFVRNRSIENRGSALTADTTLLCNGIIYATRKNKVTRELGERVIKSLLKSHNVGKRRAINFIKAIKDIDFNDTKKFMVRLRPYTEMRHYIENIK